MRHIGSLFGAPVYVCGAAILPSDRAGNLVGEIADRLRKAGPGCGPCVVLTPTQAAALTDILSEDDSDLIDEDPADPVLAGPEE